MLYSILAQVDPATISKQIEDLSKKSDRYLFLVAICGMLFVMGYMLRRFMAATDTKDAQLLESRVKLVEVCDGYRNAVEDLATTMKESTAAREKNTSFLEILVARFKNVPLILLCFSLLGCARFNGSTERTLADGTREITRFNGYTIFDGKANLAKAVSRQSKASQSVGVTGADLESSGSNAVAIIKIAADGAISVMKP